ncbi:response regulator [Vallitalea guaymasensis]|uniref:response regulator n=1 Tax=Vallitalea guaymasensis TaxID=1185412 RepID=UPI00272DBB87|nr:response regulator [Vallitalea guaymasensis]
MKKILIADDEFLVRVGLRTTINWEENGYIIVGEAKNGKEAIELFDKFDPDILLTDIQMPIINGLELIQILKDKKPSLKAVILTHYDDFSYAKEAISLGASEYILKSNLSPNNLLNILNKFNDELNIDERKSAVKKKVDKTAGYTYDERNLEKILTGKSDSKAEIKSLLRNSNITLGLQSFAVVTTEIYVDDVIASRYMDIKDLLKTVITVSSNTFLESKIPFFYFVKDNGITYLFNLDCNKDDVESKERMIYLIKKMKKSVHQFLDVCLNIGISEIDDDISNLPALYEQTTIALQYSFFDDSQDIVLYNKEMNINHDKCPVIDSKILKKHIKTFSIKELDKYIYNIFEELYRYKNIHFVKDIFIDFLSQAKFISKELNMNRDKSLNENKFNYDNFEQLYSFEMVKKYVVDIYHEITKFNVTNKSNKYSYIISKVIEYIKDNYDKDIALSEVANYVQISKSYLSLLFKQETGINYSSFLTNMRIEKSKKFLLDSNYKIYEVAEKVGFDNPYYYSKVFKDITGMTCKDYRKLNM